MFVPDDDRVAHEVTTVVWADWGQVEEVGEGSTGRMGEGLRIGEGAAAMGIRIWQAQTFSS